MRPQKTRLIAHQPAWRRYFPEGCLDAAEMALSLDMLEALRLVDAEGCGELHGNIHTDALPFVGRGPAACCHRIT